MTHVVAAAPRGHRPYLLAASIVAVPCLLFLSAMALVVGLQANGPALSSTSLPVLLVVLSIIALPLCVAAAVVVLLRGRRTRATSLRTRSFLVIVIATVVPCLLLSLLGVYAYFRAWDAAGSWQREQAAYGARELADELASLRRVPGGLSGVERARLQAAVVRAYANGNPGGAWWSDLATLEQEQVLPRWAVSSLSRRGYAIGTWEEWRPQARYPGVVAWQTGDGDVRYYSEQGFNDPSSGGPPLYRAPVGTLVALASAGLAGVIVLGLIGALLLSHGVVRPVRRVSETSRQVAEGGGGEPVEPEGPRETRELAVAFNDMNARLAKAQEAEQSFLLSVSHELKTPLTSIRGYAEALEDGALPPAQAGPVIGAESQRLERLVGDLLDSARMRKSAFAVGREQVGLADVARAVEQRFLATARDAGLELHVQTGEDHTALADADRLLQVVSNLVENAVRCTPSPGTITVETGPGMVRVADTGRGLTSDDLPRAFERFYLYSRYGTDRPVGTGLGLSIVKELTEAMGGTVDVSSALGVGTAFVVRLPAAGAAADAP